LKPNVLLLALVASLTPAASSQVPYGTGTPGTGSVTPSLTCGRAWMGNPAFSLNVAYGLGGAAAWVGISFAQSTSIFNGANLLIDLTPAQLFLVQPLSLSGPVGSAGAGSATLPYPITLPPTPSLAGLTLYAQVGIDEGNGLWAASKGLAITLAMPPRIVVGTSVGGNTDPFYVIDPTGSQPSMHTQFNGPGGVSGMNDNCTDAEFAHDGRRIYVGQVFGNAIQELNLENSPPTWSPLYAAAGPAYGIGVDHANDLTYTLAGAVSSRELTAVDSALGSPTYGQALTATSGLASLGYVERWELSPDGKRAAVLTLSRQLIIVDTDLAGTNYMGFASVGMIPVNQAIFALATGCEFTPDGLQILITIQTGGGGVGEVARFDVLLGQWIDHNPIQPGIQNIGSQSNPPAAVPAAPWEIEVAATGTFAVVSGWAGAGSLARIDLDPLNPFAWSFTRFTSPVSLAGEAWCSAISSDDTMIATCGSGQLLIFDAWFGTLLGQIPLPGVANVRAVTWE